MRSSNVEKPLEALPDLVTNPFQRDLLFPQTRLAAVSLPS